MKDKQEDKVYKSSSFEAELQRDVATNMEKFKDPLVLGELVYKLLEERENTNRILKNILAKLEALEARQSQPEEPLLAEVDEEIMAFVRKKGKVDAKNVQMHFKYKGTNAASARLNRLHERGLLQKKQVGRKTYFLPK